MAHNIANEHHQINEKEMVVEFFGPTKKTKKVVF